MENDTVSTLEDLIDDDGISQVREYQKVGGGGDSLCLRGKYGQEKSSAGVGYGIIGRNVQKTV